MMPKYTTAQIAVLTGRSERQVQRWLKDGKLPAKHLRGNLYEVDDEDISHFLPREIARELDERLAALEARITQLEGIIEGLSSNRPQRSQQATSRPSATSTLPEGWRAIADLIDEHHAPETTVMRHMRTYLKKGSWKTSDGRTVTYALDPEGIAEFERRYVRD